MGYLYMTCYKFLTESNSERILKIGAIFGEVMGKSYESLFSMLECYVSEQALFHISETC